MKRTLDIYDRKTETDAVIRFIESPIERILILVGESGCGKSAIVDKAIGLAQLPFGGWNKVLPYQFKDKTEENEAERFPQFLIDTYAESRPSWFIDSWMRKQGSVPDSWSLRLPFATFTSRAPALRDPYRLTAFYAKFSQVVGKRFDLIRLQNAENFGAQHNLVTIDKLAAQSAGPKLIVEIGTLTAEAEAAADFFRRRSRTRILEVDLFGPRESAECYAFVHRRPAPPALFESSKGNVLSIQHHGTSLADLAVSAAVRHRLDGVPPQDMAILWCVAALGGGAEVEFLSRVIDNNREFDNSLIRLTQSKILRFDGEDRVEFGHSLFTRYFSSPEFSAEVCRFGRRRIIAHIERSSDTLASDERELARQYIGIGEYGRGLEHAMHTAMEHYRQEDFRAIIDMAPLLESCARQVPAANLRVQMLLLQVAVRLGDVTAFVGRVSHLNECEDRIAVLLRAQGYYLMNRFQEAASTCEQLASFADDVFVTSRALGVRAAALIALGRHDEAAEDFGAAMVLAERSMDLELQLELARLSPEIEAEPVWRSRRTELERSQLPDRLPYLYAKCLHNFSANEVLISGGKCGLDDLEAAAAVFEAGKYPEFSYAAAMRAAVFLLAGRSERARSLLESARTFCHEAYDRFAFETNLGVASALDGAWEDACASFDLAETALSAGAFPLSDPYFRFQSAHNRAIAYAMTGHPESAHSLLMEHRVPLNCLDYDAKVARRDRLITALGKGRPIGEISEGCSLAKRWPGRACLLEVATLQFFDFNVNVLPPTFR